jgi:hypothetical protein
VKIETDTDEESESEGFSDSLPVEKSYISELSFREDMDLKNEDPKFAGPPYLLSLKHFRTRDNDDLTFYVPVRYKSTGDDLNMRLTNVFKKASNTPFSQDFVYSKLALTKPLRRETSSTTTYCISLTLSRKTPSKRYKSSECSKTIRNQVFPNGSFKW